MGTLRGSACEGAMDVTGDTGFRVPLNLLMLRGRGEVAPQIASCWGVPTTLRTSGTTAQANVYQQRGHRATRCT